MNFSPFAGHFAGAIPAIHQFAATGALVSTSTNAASAHLADNRYAHPSHQGHPSHHGSTSSVHQPTSSSSSSVNIPHFNQAQLLGKLRAPLLSTAEDMNKYGVHQQQQQQQPQQQHPQQLHYQSQYSQEVAENGNKHLRVGNSSHSLGINSMANGYHQGSTTAADQNQDLGQVCQR